MNHACLVVGSRESWGLRQSEAWLYPKGPTASLFLLTPALRECKPSVPRSLDVQCATFKMFTANSKKNLNMA